MQPNQGRIHMGEWRGVAISFVYFFCVLAAYYMIRPVREQLSSAVGSTQLPWFYAATFIATLVLTPVFAALASRWPRRVLVPVVYVFFIACLLAFMPAFTHTGLLSPRALGMVFFVWVSVFNLIVVSVFWIFMSDIWSLDQSKRLFPVIAVAGTLGALAGPALTRSLVSVIGVAPLLLISASLLGIATVCVMLLNRWARVHGARRHEVGHEDAVGGGMWDGLKQIFADPFIRGMAVLLLLADGIGTVNYALMIDYSGATFADAAARTRFHADVDLVANLLTVIVQVTLTRWLLPLRGPGTVIMLWALVSIAVLLVVVFSPDPHAPLFTLPLLLGPVAPTVLALIVSRGLAYGMAEPARHSLYTRVPRNVRYKGQDAVDTAVWRFGDLAIATGMNGLKSLGMTIGGFAGLSALAAFAAAGIGWRLWKRVEKVGETVPVQTETGK
ncbi:NTP/NDP exchange transporter [Pseudoxanthomonas sacheonensis]|uniref:NTP/NDP exchange transporter n=1 Tax=Pseudoxanthomonas sacheonensis TaxID=443615 RepID=UPI0013D56E2B|nr:MFS transporter [Pseudoxanthomonas sacheonensis]KAF1712890.1 MFS transporter [Pseudoxanthomonas sacheonensis]